MSLNETCKNGAIIPYMVSTLPNILNQKKPNKRSRILLSHPVFRGTNEDHGVFKAYAFLTYFHLCRHHTQMLLCNEDL